MPVDLESASGLRDAGSLPDPDRPVGTADEGLPFDHVVVVMMENHSFDNLLGALSLTRPDIMGLTFRDGKPVNSNPGAEGMPSEVFAFPLPDTSQGSEVSQTWKDAHGQINGGAMDGFVASTRSMQPMGYYTSETLPFAFSLASRFTVGNRWFSSLPGPTYPNRRFLLAGTAYGCTVTNSETLLDQPPPNGTIFDLLSNYGISWCNYFSDIPMTMVIPTTIIDHPDKHLPIDAFFDHCRTGALPAVSFVDPRIGVLSRVGQPIAALPPLLRELLSRVGADLESTDPAQTEEDPQDMYYGEAWAHSVLQEVLTSPCWPSTLLIYIYDEHGGYYDHVSPEAAIEPDGIQPVVDGGPPGRYDTYGPRVPAIVVSSYSKAGGSTDVTHDHTSVLATIQTKWNLPALTRRDANANPVLDFLDFDQAPDNHPEPLEPPSPTGASGPASKQPNKSITPLARTKSGMDIEQKGTNTEMTTPSTNNVATEAGQNQRMTFWIAVVGIAAVLIALVAALIAFANSRNPGQVIPAVLGAVTAAIGTLAGLVAGHAAGSAGKAQSDQRASDNEQDATAGRALAQSMLADEPRSTRPEGRALAGAADDQSQAAEIALRHAELAKRLFPDLS